MRAHLPVAKVQLPLIFGFLRVAVLEGKKQVTALEFSLLLVKQLVHIVVLTVKEAIVEKPCKSRVAGCNVEVAQGI